MNCFVGDDDDDDDDENEIVAKCHNKRNKTKIKRNTSICCTK